MYKLIVAQLLNPDILLSRRDRMKVQTANLLKFD